MNLQDRPSPCAPQPIRKRTGQIVCAPVAWLCRFRPPRQVIRPKTGPSWRAPDADTGTGSTRSAAIHHHTRRRARHPRPAQHHNPHSAKPDRGFVQSSFNEVAERARAQPIRHATSQNPPGSKEWFCLILFWLEVDQG